MHSRLQLGLKTLHDWISKSAFTFRVLLYFRRAKYISSTGHPPPPYCIICALSVVVARYYLGPLRYGLFKLTAYILFYSQILTVLLVRSSLYW